MYTSESSLEFYCTYTRDVVVWEGGLRPGSGNKTHEEPVSQPRSGADLGTMEENGGNSVQSG